MILKAEQHCVAAREIAGVQVNVVSYKIGERFHCHVSNFDPGATIARAEGPSQQEAELLALSKAAQRLQSKKS